MKIFKEIKILALGIISFCSTPVSAQSYESYVQCEDTCRHIQGIDLSHYQGEVFWEAVGDNSKMAYVYLKATEGGTRIDPTYKKNIELAHRYGLKVGSYHFFVQRWIWFNRWKTSNLNVDQAIRIFYR